MGYSTAATRCLRWKESAAVILLAGVFLALPASAAWRDWTAREDPPSPVPDRIILTWCDDPATTAAVTWRTDTSVDSAWAEIAPADPSPDFDRKAWRVSAVTESLTTAGRTALFHSVRFTGLAPGRVYAYRVGSALGLSEWFQFRTAPTRFEAFRFLYLGDAQSAILPCWSRAIRAAYSDAPDARFLVFTGDLVTRGFDDALWGEWFDAGSWILATVPTLAVPGNHEYKSDVETSGLTPHWRVQFTMPENGAAGLEDQCYYVDYPGVRVVGLNSNEGIDEEGRWLETVLASNREPWSVVFFHHPVYSASGDRDNADLRASWKPLFDRYRVALVLTGHDHVYARGQAPPPASGVDSSQGTVYVVSVSGPKMYDLTSNRWMDRAAENTQLYQVITVTPDTLDYRAMMVTGELYDAFALVRRGDGPYLLLDRAPALPERTFKNSEVPKTKE
jgi:hypothetical protein